ncbi:uncharacterized protein LOC129722314 isoform X2 [Wyeomyia smithii]|uniref:uncharacterized protein LOC129722314 isoform X2 n=1 Tax=Wyeomyia smithii TaxID=174621 RepID=UPI00246819B2|nr:uncharacterized protein LOC129722314 isoform X2 [Wyeomyia smithii]
MSESEIKVQTFYDLLYSEERIKYIPLKKIARISLNSLRRQESDFEIYEFLFTKVPVFFKPDEFEVEVSRLVLPELVKHLEKVVNEIKDSALLPSLVDNLKLLLLSANVLLKFAEYVTEISKTYQLYQTVTIFLEFLTHNYDVIGTIVHGKAEEDTIIKQLFTLCQKIQHLIIAVLAPSNEPGFYFPNLDEIEKYNCFKEGIYALWISDWLH